MLNFFSAHKPKFWFTLAIVPIGLLLLSHFVFVKWLYMRPCTECVYIRFAFFLCAILFVTGGLLAKYRYARYVNSFASCGALIYGLQHSIVLLSTEGAGTCAITTEPFSLFGFEKIFPVLFNPTGECGFTAPFVPHDVTLSGLQGYLVNLYNAAEGWYLIPQWQLGSMAGCSFMLLFLLLLCVLYAEFQSHILTKGNN